MSMKARYWVDKLGRRLTVACLCCLLALVVVLTLACATATAAERSGSESDGGPYAVAVNSDQKTTAATDGDMAVWAEKTASGWCIFGRTLDPSRSRTSQSGPFKISEAAGQPVALTVGDGYVAWQEGASPNGSIWAAEAEPGAEPFCMADGQAGEPAIGSGILAWVDFSEGNGDIVGLLVDELTSEDPVVLNDDVSAQREPAVSDDLLVWQDDRNGNWDIYAAQLYGGVSPWGSRSTRCHSLALIPGKEFAVCKAAGDQTVPAVWDGVVVWQDGRNGDADIWAAWSPSSLGSDEERCVSQPAQQRTVVQRLCAGSGDQVAPTVADGVVAWEDRAAGDIAGYDLAQEQGVTICDAKGAQSAPSAAGETVVWLDRRGSEVNDVWAADLDALNGDDSSLLPDWTDQDVLTLFLNMFADLGVFDEICYSTDGGDTYSDWQAIDDVAELQLPEADGAYHIAIKFRDASGREFGPVTFTVHRDTEAPVTQVPHTAAVTDGSAALKFKVRDRLSPRAMVTVQVRARGGKVLKTVSYGTVKTRTWVTRKLTHLPKGAVVCSVRAQDLAGNVQKHAAGARLIR